MSVSPVPLFAPRVTVDVVAVGLPETRNLLLVEPDPANPLRALPEIKVRNEHARGATMLGRQRLAVVLVDDPGLAVHEVLEREVGGIAAIGELGGVLRCRLDSLEQRVDRYPLPGRVELRPFRDAMDVLGHRLAWEGEELFPFPAFRPVAS